MMKYFLLAYSFFACLILASNPSGAHSDKTPRPHLIKTAVIGGMANTTEVWKKIVEMFEYDTGYIVETTVSGPIEQLAPAIREGKVDLAIMHSSDTTSNFIADGYATNLRPWARNDMVIYGPLDDPAGITDLENGTDALTMIAETQSPFIDTDSLGSRTIAHQLWQEAEIKPIGNWYLKDENQNGEKRLLRYAAELHAYIIVGRIPVIMEKLLPAEGMGILVENDPAMRRPYMVMEVRGDIFPDINSVGARKLADYLLSDKVQNFLADWDGENGDGIPLFHPVSPPALKQ